MPNQSDAMGRLKANWRRRAEEHTTFRAELRVIPRLLVKIVWALYIAALVIAALASIFEPQSLIKPLVSEPVGIRVLGMFGMVTGIALGASLIILFYGYIWADAKRRGMSAFLWLLVALLVPNLIGVILYFIVREPLPLDCPQCGRTVNPHFNFCPSCKFNLRPNCPQCRRAIGPGARFCPDCGFAIPADAPSQEATPTA